MASQMTVVFANNKSTPPGSSALRKCTCVIENDSDSEEESSFHNFPATCSSSSSNSSIASSSASSSSSSSSSSTLLSSQTRLSIARSSPAWHHSEALRRTRCLANVFCACYDPDIVLSNIQKPPSDTLQQQQVASSGSGSGAGADNSSSHSEPYGIAVKSLFSPLQLVLLEASNVLQVFTIATSNCQVVWNKKTNVCEICQQQAAGEDTSATEESQPSDGSSDEPTSHASGLLRPKKPASLVQTYRNGLLATEIILRFYLQVFEWRMVSTSSSTSTSSEYKVLSTEKSTNSNHSTSRSKHPRLPLSLTIGTGFPVSHTQGKSTKGQSDTSAVTHAPQFPFRVVLRPVPVVIVQPAGRDSSMRANSLEIFTEPNDPEDLASSYPWKDIFLGLYRFLWQDEEVDSVLVTNMTRITKTLAVHQVPLFIMASVEHQGLSIFARMAVHAYNPELASLLHGLVHVAQRKKAHQVYRQIIHTMIDSILQPPFSFLTVAMHHARLGHLVEALCGMVCMDFPNTFRYSIHRATQLASYETIPAFERLLFPLKTLPTDPSLHQDIQQEVLHMLCDHPHVFERLVSLGITQIIHLNMRHKSRGIPDYILVDLVKCTVEKSLKYGHNIKELLPFLQKMASSLCLLINYRRHHARIEQFANCNRFSDSDSESNSESDSEVKVDLDLPIDYQVTPTTIQKGVSGGDPSRNPEAFEAPGEHDDALCEEEDTRELLRNVDTLSPLGSTTLVIHVILVLRAIIAVGRDALDIVLARQQLCASLLALFDRFRDASILHCSLVQVLLQILNRTTSGRVNNPLLRSLFQPPASLLQFIMSKLNRTNKPRTLRFAYEVHLSIIGVKIDRISSAPTLQQEIVRQFGHKITSWQPFCSSLVSRHYQQMDALSDHAIMPAPSLPNAEKPLTPVPTKKSNSFRNLLSPGPSSPSSESLRHQSPSSRSRRNLDDDPMEVLLKSLSESSSCAFLSSELQPFRRLPTNSEGIGGDQNLATGKEAVHPSDMYKSRSQSQFPKAILDILHAHHQDEEADPADNLNKPMSSPFETVEYDKTVASDVYQKNSEWVKVHLVLDKQSCQLSVETIETVASSNTPTSALSKLNQRAQLLLQMSSKHFSRHGLLGDKPNRRFVVSNARPWIVFGRSIKNPDAGAFGFQVDVIDQTTGEDQTLTFVTRSELDRSKWCQAMLKSVQESRTKLRRPSCAIDPAQLVSLVKRVAFKVANNGSCVLSVLPDADQMAPWVVGTSFYLESEVPEELPFFGIYHGIHGIHKYLALFHACLEVVHAQLVSLQPSGFTVVLDYEMTVKTSQEYLESEANRNRNSSMDSYASPTTNPRRWPMKDVSKEYLARNSSVPIVNCRCTDTYYIDSNQILGLTRTITKEDAKKLVDLLCSDEKDPISQFSKGAQLMAPPPSMLSMEFVEALMLNATTASSNDDSTPSQKSHDSPGSDGKNQHERDEDVLGFSKQPALKSLESCESLAVAEPVEPLT